MQKINQTWVSTDDTINHLNNNMNKLTSNIKKAETEYQ